MIDNMVDENDTDNLVGNQVAGWQMALLLVGAFRSLVDAVHDQLAQEGHPDVRPAHGFALQAIGAGTSAPELAARLGVSRQAAAKTVQSLETLGYVTRAGDPADSRRLLVAPTERGRELVEKSARAFESALNVWRSKAGDAEIDHVAYVLQTLDLPALGRLDLGRWSQ